MDYLFDFSKLKDLIESTSYYDTKEQKYKKYTKKSFAKAIGISYYSLYKKLQNIVPFTQLEIMRIVTLLEIPLNEISLYFFTEKVKKTQF